jgi:hypothetical protein
MYINLLRPSASLRTTTFYIKKSYVLPSLYLCVFFSASERTEIISLYKIIIHVGLVLR